MQGTHLPAFVCTCVRVRVCQVCVRMRAGAKACRLRGRGAGPTIGLNTSPRIAAYGPQQLPPPPPPTPRPPPAWPHQDRTFCTRPPSSDCSSMLGSRTSDAAQAGRPAASRLSATSRSSAASSRGAPPSPTALQLPLSPAQLPLPAAAAEEDDEEAGSKEARARATSRGVRWSAVQWRLMSSSLGAKPYSRTHLHRRGRQVVGHEGSEGGGHTQSRTGRERKSKIVLGRASGAKQRRRDVQGVCGFVRTPDRPLSRLHTDQHASVGPMHDFSEYNAA